MYCLTDTTWGPHVVLERDVNVGGALRLCGEYSIHQARALRALATPGTAAVDVGANMGALSLPMMQGVGPDGFLLAVEPQPVVARALNATLALNAEHPGQFRVEQVAVGDRPRPWGMLAIDHSRPAIQYGCNRVSDAGPLAVDGQTIDALVDKWCGDRPLSVVKIDVEGHESVALEGAVDTLRGRRPVLMIENDRADRLYDLRDQVRDYGYECYWFTTPTHNPLNFKGFTRDIYFDQYGREVFSYDMLCFPLEAELPDFLPDLPLCERDNVNKVTRIQNVAA